MTDPASRNLALEVAQSKVAWDDKTAPPMWLEVVNIIKKKKWQNNENTFIFVQPDISILTNERLSRFTSFLWNCHPDHRSVQRSYGQDVIRLCAEWWTETFGLVLDPAGR